MAKKSTTKKTTASKAVKSTSKKTTKSTSKKTSTKKSPTATNVTAKKTATKKATTSKSAAKKTVKKTATDRKPLPTATKDKCFWTSDGQVLANLADLAVAFGSMDDTVFVYHANKEKNDFADWVEHVFEDASCAADLRSCRKPRSAKTVVVRHLKYYRV